MEQNSFCEIIADQTERALWEVKNVIDCIPDALWDRIYCDMPLWKHVYHTLHSLDQWFINPMVYAQPPFHCPALNDLDVVTEGYLSRDEIQRYVRSVSEKIRAYLTELTDELLLSCPQSCPYTRFTLILAQYRHLHTHMGMLMGYIIAETGQWPRVLGLTHEIPSQRYDKFF